MPQGFQGLQKYYNPNGARYIFVYLKAKLTCVGLLESQSSDTRFSLLKNQSGLATKEYSPMEEVSLEARHSQDGRHGVRWRMAGYRRFCQRSAVPCVRRRPRFPAGPRPPFAKPPKSNPTNTHIILQLNQVIYIRKGNIIMLDYRKSAAASQLAQEMLQEGERGLTSVAACLPNLVIAAGYWHSYAEPLRVHPCVFLLDREEKIVADPFRVNDDNITYYVAGVLGNGAPALHFPVQEVPTPQDLLQQLHDVADILDSQGFTVEPVRPTLHRFI